MRRPPLRKALRVSIAPLVAGLLLSVGVAWAFALVPPFQKIESHGHTVLDQSGAMYSAVELVGRGRAWWVVQPGGPEAGADTVAAVSWVDLPSTATYSATYLFGWPAPCLTCYGYLPGAIDPTKFPSPTWPPPYATWGSWHVTVNQRTCGLPLHPIWTALLFDSVFYAVLVVAAVAGTRFARRVARVRGGLCPSCGYDRRGHVGVAGIIVPCPECGNAAS